MTNRPVELTAEMPRELQGWNWGAFFLNWIWGLGNRTPIALLALIPLFGFAWMVVLGVKGNQWAWQNETWKSAEHFRRTQRNWAIAGAIVWAALVLVVGLMIWGLVTLMFNNGAYRKSMDTVRNDPRIQEIYGTPIQDGWLPVGHVSIRNSTGDANLEISISGPRASGVVFSEALMVAGEWRLTYLAVRTEGRDGLIVLVPRE